MNLKQTSTVLFWRNLLTPGQIEIKIMTRTVMMILNASGPTKLLQTILIIIRNKFVIYLKKSLCFLIKINLMRLNNFISSMKSITISHSWKKLQAKRSLRNFNFPNNQILSGLIRFKIMTQNQTMHLHKIQVIFKSIYKPGNAEIFLDYRFRNLI
jgi:hypothetical protein